MRPLSIALLLLVTLPTLVVVFATGTLYQDGGTPGTLVSILLITIATLVVIPAGAMSFARALRPESFWALWLLRLSLPGILAVGAGILISAVSGSRSVADRLWPTIALGAKFHWLCLSFALVTAMRWNPLRPSKEDHSIVLMIGSILVQALGLMISLSTLWTPVAPYSHDAGVEHLFRALGTLLTLIGAIALNGAAWTIATNDTLLCRWLYGPPGET